MKKKESSLFQQFKDAEIVKETLSLVNGGDGPGSSSTGDNDCTNRPGLGPDCGDSQTDAIFDTDPTGASGDTCTT